MNDSISRQAAIDLFPNDALEWDTYDGYIAPHLARRMIEGLPSAQPTYTDAEIQKMQDLEQAQIEKAYQLGREDAQSPWIPCSERLPDEKDAGILEKIGIKKLSEYVLATVEVKDTGERMTVKTYTCDGKWNWDMKYVFPDYKVIAWMPMPKPYEEVKDETD